PAAPANAADAPIGATPRAQALGRPIRRIVIDEDGFPIGSLQQFSEPVDQRSDIVALVEGRNDDGELRSRRGQRAQRGDCSLKLTFPVQYLRRFPARGARTIMRENLLCRSTL